MEERLDRIDRNVAEVKKILTGNGHPEEGLAFKVAQHAEFVNFWKKFGWIVLAAIAGIPPTVMAALIISLFQRPH